MARNKSKESRLNDPNEPKLNGEHELEHAPAPADAVPLTDARPPEGATAPQLITDDKAKVRQVPALALALALATSNADLALFDPMGMDGPSASAEELGEVDVPFSVIMDDGIRDASNP